MSTNKQKLYRYVVPIDSEDRKVSFSSRVIKQAKWAKELYGIVQYPSINDFKRMIHYNMIKNCAVKVEDVDNMISILGSNMSLDRIRDHCEYCQYQTTCGEHQEEKQSYQRGNQG